MVDGLGIREQTVIVFNSDHGDLMGDHNLFFKSNFYEESTHVPLIVWTPEEVRRELDLGPSRRIDALASQEQLMPFMLRAAGAEIPSDVGTAPPLTDVIGGRHPGAPVHGIFGDQTNRQLALIEERYKYIWWANGRFEQLFDRQADPTELTNLADDPDYDDELGADAGGAGRDRALARRARGAGQRRPARQRLRRINDQVRKAQPPAVGPAAVLGPAEPTGPPNAAPQAGMRT